MTEIKSHSQREFPILMTSFWWAQTSTIPQGLNILLIHMGQHSWTINLDKDPVSKWNSSVWPVADKNLTPEEMFANLWALPSSNYLFQLYWWDFWWDSLTTNTFACCPQGCDGTFLRSYHKGYPLWVETQPKRCHGRLPTGHSISFPGLLWVPTCFLSY